MSRPDPDAVGELFLRACELPADQRGAFLDAACKHDPKLREEIDSLLEHDRDLPEILTTGLFTDRPRVEPPLERIGPFRIIAKIAEGGMGVVYRAEQETPIRRAVAIKLIRLGSESRQVIARFESERQALALMDHPNIARVLDAGTTADGRPYFAMDFVEGEPITTFCDMRRLPIAERLALFLQICAGVQHAHQKAIIHRDIKPSNVLVTVRAGKAVPIIIDFGIAKAIGEPLGGHKFATEAGQLIGTPEYMSPEQAEMTGQHIDTRTDVYSLGALLYELLAGSPPFDPDDLRRRSFDEIRRRIREDDPPPPSARLAATARSATVSEARGTEALALQRRLRGDLDLIVAKALHKERASRYDSPAELAADIRRHLEHEPLLAIPPTPLYRLRKVVRKHRVGVAFGTLLLLLLVGFAASMSLQAARVTRERDRANDAAQTTERALGLTMKLLESYDPNRTERSDGRELLDHSLAQIDQLEGRPLLQGRLLVATARVYSNLGFHDEAQRLLERARPQLRAAVGADHPETLKATGALAFNHFYQGDHERAEPLFVEALAGQRATLGDENQDTLGTMVNLANLYTDQGRYDESERLQREALATLRRTLGNEHRRTLSSMLSLGILYTTSGRHADAEPLLAEALATQQRLLGGNHPRTLYSMNSLAVLYTYQQRHDEAERLFAEVLERKRRVLGEDHPSTLKTLYNFACLAALQQRRDRALELLHEAVERGYAGHRMLDDADLDSLRGDPEFERLLGIVRRRL